MTERVFQAEKKEMDMNEAALPYISIRVDKVQLNLLHGYCSNLDEMLLRESITPLTPEQNFDVIITENDNIVKKVIYEVSDISTGQIVESGSIIALEKEEKTKVAKIRLKETLEQEVEYAAKITLITNQSKRIYFYTRIKVIPNSYLEEKLDFVKEFHTKTFDKETCSDLRKYLESKGSADQSTFAKVNIHSSLEMVSWGSLEPIILFENLPQITEYTKDTASVVLNYQIKVKTPSGIEEYAVIEKYRFRYTTNRTYLYNFERTMEAVFDPNLVSLSKSEFKIGITNQTDLEIIPNQSNNIFAFVRGRELWLYIAAEKESRMVRVFSFRQKDTDYIRDTFEQHGVKILNLYDDGTIDFMVYGYMNRGEYEGRVGIVLYRYDSLFDRIEEQIYIPVNTTYQMLTEEIGKLAYRNDKDIFYFSLFETLYSYNLVSKTLTVLAQQAPEETVVFSGKKQYTAWQEKKEKAESVLVLMLETGEFRRINAGEEEYIRLLGSIDEHMIYGLVKKEDISVDQFGETLYPMYSIKIADENCEVLKSYEADGYFTNSVMVEENLVTLKRLKKDSTTFSGYQEGEKDYIMNQPVAQSEYILSKRITDQMRTEYYISLPSYYKIEQIPIIKNTKNTVILEDTTVRVMKSEEFQNRYYAYAFGSLVMSSKDAGEAVQAANAAVGTVMDSSGRILWQRGTKPSKAEILGIQKMNIGNGLDSLQVCLKMIFEFKSIDAKVQNYDRRESSIVDWMKANMKAESLVLKGVTLDEVLFFVGMGRPVLAMKGQNSAVLITAYDSLGVTVLDPTADRIKKLSLREAEELFEEAGNLYISYYDY